MLESSVDHMAITSHWCFCIGHAETFFFSCWDKRSLSTNYVLISLYMLSNAFKQYGGMKSIVKHWLKSLCHHIRNGSPESIMGKGTDTELR